MTDTDIKYNCKPILDRYILLARYCYDKGKSVQSLKHDVTKGTYREIFASELLEPVLSPSYAIGTGIIVDSFGQQSKQCDIIVYDRTVLPCILEKSGLGIFPVESVVYAIEVKSRLTKKGISEALENFRSILDLHPYRELNSEQVNYPITILMAFESDSRQKIKLSDSSSKKERVRLLEVNRIKENPNFAPVQDYPEIPGHGLMGASLHQFINPSHGTQCKIMNGLLILNRVYASHFPSNGPFKPLKSNEFEFYETVYFLLGISNTLARRESQPKPFIPFDNYLKYQVLTNN